MNFTSAVNDTIYLIKKKIVIHRECLSCQISMCFHSVAELLMNSYLELWQNWWTMRGEYFIKITSINDVTLHIIFIKKIIITDIILISY